MKYLILLLCTTLVACITPPEQATLHDFGVSEVTTVTAPVDITVTAPDWLMDTAIFYRLLYSAPTEVKTYNLDRWQASPSELFTKKLLSFGTVFKYPMRIQLLSFEQQFTSAQQTRVLLSFRVQAYRPDTDAIVGTKLFQLQRATISADAKGAVTAFSALTNEAIMQLGVWQKSLQ